MSNREFPILFSSLMVNRILHGYKTQTRRLKMPRAGGLIATTGNILWVRETWRRNDINMAILLGTKYNFKADVPDPKLFKWKPSIFMPKEACRIRLEITAVRQEKLNDIGTRDIYKEGFIPDMGNLSPNDWYESLWSEINGRASWLANPDVWVITFKKL